LRKILFCILALIAFVLAFNCWQHCNQPEEEPDFRIEGPENRGRT
jgi:hypothetical protein